MTGRKMTSAWATFRFDHKWTHLGHNSRYLRQKEREESHKVRQRSECREPRQALLMVVRKTHAVLRAVGGGGGHFPPRFP